MRLVIGKVTLVFLVVGILLQLAALVFFEFVSAVPTFTCLGCTSAVRAPVISLTWFSVLFVLSMISLAGVFSRVGAALALVAAISGFIIVTLLVFYYFPSGYSSAPWWPALPIYWAGSFVVIGVLMRAVASGVLPRPVTSTVRT